MNVLFTTHRVEAPNRHIVRKSLSLLTPLGMKVQSPDFGVRVSRDAEAKILTTLQQAGIGPGDQVGGIHPGVGHHRKRWDPDRYAQGGDRLQEREGARVVLTAGPGEDALARRMASQMRIGPVVLPPVRAAPQIGRASCRERV